MLGKLTIVDSSYKTFLPSSTLLTNGSYKYRGKTEDDYCKYYSDNLLFQLSVSSMYLAALVASLGAASVTRSFSR